MTTRSEIAAILRTTEKNLDARAVGLKIAPVCERCGGSGSYSFNQIDGDRCYGCNGKGHVRPTDRDLPALMEAAKAAAADGRLDQYLRLLEARKIADTGRKTVLNAWTATRVNSILHHISHMVRDDQVDGLGEIRAANKKMHDAFQAVHNAACKLGRKSTDADFLAVAEIVKTALATIAETDAAYEPLPSLVKYSNERKAANEERAKTQFRGW